MNGFSSEGFIDPALAAIYGSVLPSSQAIYTKSEGKIARSYGTGKVDEAQIQRALAGGDINDILSSIGMTAMDVQRAITTNTAGFPVRENLEAVAKILIPLETPLRNRLPRTVGSGKASQWRQLLSLGGGYAGATLQTGSGAAASSTIVVTSVAGFALGDTLLVDTGANQEVRIISGINAGTLTITVTAPWTVAHNAAAVVKYGVNPGSETTGAIQTFFAETGAPGEHTSVYQNQIANYALMGTFGRVSGFAMAAGATFQNQLATEKSNAVWNLMLNEENALINGDATSNLAPWGDGVNPLAFNGLVNLITTGNGTPADQVQVAVGALTIAHMDAQLTRQYKRGAMSNWILASPQEIQSMVHLAEQSTNIRFSQTPGNVQLGASVQAYTHPITGEPVPIMPSRFLSPGNMIFGCDKLPDGSPALDVQVLPQVQLPQLAPNTNIQGYVAQEIAPAANAPQMYPFLVSVFEVLRMKSSLHFCISKGLTPV